MEETVTEEIQNRMTAKNEKMKEEHQQMTLDLKHQAVLMKSLIMEEGKKSAKVEETNHEVVVAKTMQSALVRKLKFVAKKLEVTSKKLEVANKKLDLFKKKGYDFHEAEDGALTIEDKHMEEFMHEAVRLGSIQQDQTEDIMKAAHDAMHNAMRGAIEEADAIPEEEEEEPDENTFNPGEAEENLEFLTSITDELQKHLENRDDWARDAEITRKFNDFISRQVSARGGGGGRGGEDGVCFCSCDELTPALLPPRA
jgi:hypothetical protein